MKLERTINYNFGWLVLVALVNVAFLLVFFLLLSSNFILQQGISVSMPFSRFTLGPQTNQQIISITGGAVPAIYFRDQRVTMEQLGPLLDAAKREGQSIVIKADRSTSYETVAGVTNAALEHAGSIPVARLLSPVQLYLCERLPYVCGATLRFCVLFGLLALVRVTFRVLDQTR